MDFPFPAAMDRFQTMRVRVLVDRPPGGLGPWRHPVVIRVTVLLSRNRITNRRVAAAVAAFIFRRWHVVPSWVWVQWRWHRHLRETVWISFWE